MTTATRIPPPQKPDLPLAGATPEEPGKKGHTLLWLVLSGLVLLLTMAIGTFVVRVSGDDHSSRAGEPVLVEVPGYAYTDPSPSDADAFDSLMTETNEMLNVDLFEFDVYTSWSLHEVANEDADPFAELQLIELNPQLIDLPGDWVPNAVWILAQDMAPLAMSNSHHGSDNFTDETIDGERVVVAEAPRGDFLGFTWYHEGTVTGVTGYDADALRTFVEAYLAEQNG